MKMLHKFLSLSLLALSSALALAAEPTAWEKIKSYAHDRKTEAVAEGKKMIAATDRQIAALKKEIAQSTGEARKAHEQNMKELQAKRQVAQAELVKMQKSAARTWDATKEGFSNAYRDLQQAYEKAASAPSK
jgi:Skp family chaperone for outer membrane proteins